ncbi:hypothetical protein BP5796_13201 [Coleophoma crateriformis]|uniref:Ricin B lectin domain-containing protein n=1 Tax=Coleophoma crateriformis TaxID=565419 RepID=A0A3D8Q3A5_9HELO|nr:hypothetical protein BP5796_13201 [Coleophoma crateriformis]
MAVAPQPLDYYGEMKSAQATPSCQSYPSNPLDYDNTTNSPKLAGQVYAEHMTSGNLELHTPEAWRIHRAEAPVQPYRFPESERPPRRKICGLPLQWFWILAGVVAVVAIAAIAGGVAGGLLHHRTTSVNRSSASQSSISGNNSANTRTNTVPGTTTPSLSPTSSSTTSSGSPSTSLAPSSTAVGIAMPTTNLASLDPTLWYCLSNNFLGSSVFLDNGWALDGSSNATPRMVRTTCSTDQFWQFRPSADNLTYSICALSYGVNMRLDVLTSGPEFAPVDETSLTQTWTVVAQGDGTWMILNAAYGAYLHLDTYSNTYEIFMAPGDKTGQHWTFLGTLISALFLFALNILVPSLGGETATKKRDELGSNIPDGTPWSTKGQNSEDPESTLLIRTPGPASVPATTGPDDGLQLRMSSNQATQAIGSGNTGP